MKKKIIFCFLFLVFMVTNGNATETRPVAVSPGSDVGVAVVGQSCPTFSWSAVQWTEAYRVVVFEAVGSEALAYEEMEALASPALSKEIRGPALSWTPSEDERLSSGKIYVWYVQAVDGYGGGMWSEGKLFKVEETVSLVGVEEKLREKLREYGLSEEVITEVFQDVTSEVKEVVLRGADTQRSLGVIGILGNETGTNTWYGEDAGASITSGYDNSFFGYRAGYSNTEGWGNTFIGYRAGYKNNVSYNTFIGYRAGYTNTTAQGNAFLGYNAGYYNSTGPNNTFIGYRAGYFNTTGPFNTFVGSAAGYYNTEGQGNAFLGYNAGFFNTTGPYNTFIGYNAGFKNTTGGSNTFLGRNAGYRNRAGGSNTFLGHNAGYSNTAGSNNTFLGYNAGRKNTKGYRNTSIGRNAGYSNTTGNSNVFLGFEAGYNESGSNKLYIDNSDTSSPLIYGEFDTDIVRINGKLGVGKNPTNLIDVTGGAYCDGTTWVDASSREYKENIESLEAEEAMHALEGLDPVKFNYKKNKEEEHVGFIAEDVPDLVATKDRKGMSAIDVVAVLTKVVQEQQKTISELKNRITKLEKERQEKP